MDRGDPGPTEGTFIHDAYHSTLERAAEVFRDVRMPTRGPEWLGCVAIEFFWVSNERGGSATFGSLTVTGFSGRKMTGRQLEFRMFVPPPPQVPPSEGRGRWEEIEDRHGWYEDLATTTHDSGQRTGGSRIAWTQGDTHYFELMGSFPLGVALDIADSTKPLK